MDEIFRSLLSDFKILFLESFIFLRNYLTLGICLIPRGSARASCSCLPNQKTDSAAVTEMQPPSTPVLEAGGQRRGWAGLSPGVWLAASSRVLTRPSPHMRLCPHFFFTLRWKSPQGSHFTSIPSKSLNF